MRKIFKGAGAATLAAATVVTGLSFGPAAAIAAPAGKSGAAATSSAPADGSRFNLLSQASNGQYYGNYAGTMLKAYDTRSTAEANSTTLVVKRVGDNFRVFVDEGQFKGQCLFEMKPDDILSERPTCNQDDSLFKIDDHGRFASYTTGKYVGAPKIGAGYLYYSFVSTGPDVKFEGVNAGLTAQVDGVDVVNRTAQLSGTGKPNSTIIIGDDQEAKVDSDGKWTATLENLKYGDNAVHLENWVGTTKDSEKDINVELKVTAPSAAASYTTNNDEDITISGSGQQGADVEIKNENGKTVATTTANATTGRYTAKVAAPDAAGKHSFTVTQSINKVDAGSVSVDFDYGTGISITSPADNLIHPGGQIDFAGKGEAGGDVTIREEGKQGVIKAGKVLANGNWAINGVELDNKEHKLVVTQVSKGNNTTTAKVTLNPGSSAIAPLVVTTPAEGATVPSTGKMITVTGTGEPDSTIKITASNGRPAGQGKVGKDGKFSFLAEFNATKYTATIEQIIPGAETQSKTVNFVVEAADAVNLPFTVTSPKTNAEVTTVSDKIINVTGTGKAGAVVKITAANGRLAGQGTVDTTGHFSFPAEFAYTYYTATVDMIPTSGAKESVTVTNFTVVPDGVNKPFDVTAPVSGGTAPSKDKMVTFTGHGKAGAVINVLAASNGRLAGTGTVGRDGNFTVQAEFAALKYSAHVTMGTGPEKQTITVTDFTVVAQ